MPGARLFDLFLGPEGQLIRDLSRHLSSDSGKMGDKFRQMVWLKIAKKKFLVEVTS